MNHQKTIKWLNRLSLIILIGVIVIGLYIMKNGIGLIEGLDFGPGSYYYTDIPNWKEIFFVENNISFMNLHPSVYMVLFFGWGFLMWKLWNYLETKIK